MNTMDLTALTDLAAGLGIGVVGVAFVVIGLPVVLAMLPGRIASARRRRQWTGVAITLLVGAVFAISGALLWNQALSTHPGAFDQALMMLAMTLLPFTATLALVALIVGWTSHRSEVVVAAPGLHLT
jgi:hypothetical protein